MPITWASSKQAQRALSLVSSLQQHFYDGFVNLSPDSSWETVDWQRHGGLFGGGSRLAVANSSYFNRASINVSQVHYENEPEKTLSSATALSTIIHPNNPLAPSVHLHTSWTEMRDGHAYWRIMADLNPSTPIEADKLQFLANTQQLCHEETYATALAQGDHYFFIPALNRHRGVVHFYLENYQTQDANADRELADNLIRQVMNNYHAILAKHKADLPEDRDFKRQLDYHTLYFFQVLTLDRGTTSGLLIHNENDLGIMGSLPAFVDRKLLLSWLDNVEKPQRTLLKDLIDCLPDQAPSVVDDKVKLKLAEAVRNHYQNHPESLALQAKAFSETTTVDNHK